MKTITKFIFGLLFVLSMVQLNAQTVTVNQISVNNQNMVVNCGTIDLGTNQNNQLNIIFTIANSSGGSGYARVMLKYSSSDVGYPIGNQIDVPASLWGNNVVEISRTFYNVDIQASQVQLNGSSIFVQYTKDATPSNPYKSCEFPIIKTQIPTFNLSPTSLSILCGSTTAQTFTVNNVYNSPGTLSYLWEVGPSWKFSTSGVACANTFSTASNVLSLTPNTFPLANVKVTPILNGVSYPQKTCTVSLAPFTGNFNIVGSSGLCTSGVYSVSGLPTGSTITWSSSNTSIASLSAPSNTQVTANMVSNGTFTLTATVQNPCGQMLVLSKVISVGQPGAVYWVDKVEPYMYQFNAYDYWGCTQNVNTYVWQIVAQTGGVYTTYLGGDITSVYAVPPFSIHMTLTASNGCASNSQDIYLSLNSEEEELYRIKPKEYPTAVIFPNPSNTEITLKLPISKNSKETKIFIYNSLGKIIDAINVENNQFIYNVEKLSKGVYFVEYNLGEIKNTSKFIVH